MKLSKALLSAILAGISLQGLESCTKKIDKPEVNKPNEKEKEKQPENKYPDNCPACGMG